MNGNGVLIFLAVFLMLFNIIVLATGIGSELNIAGLLIAVFVFVMAMSRKD